MAQIRRQPCTDCPYRLDAPSGVWSAEDYGKLPRYDAETGSQPLEPFACHATPDFYCHGWAVCHSARGHEYELLSLRLFAPGAEIPRPAVPLFASGTEAAAHGLRDIKRPKRKARAAMARLLVRYGRLRRP